MRREAPRETIHGTPLLRDSINRAVLRGRQTKLRSFRVVDGKSLAIRGRILSPCCRFPSPTFRRHGRPLSGEESRRSVCVLPRPLWPYGIWFSSSTWRASNVPFYVPPPIILDNSLGRLALKTPTVDSGTRVGFTVLPIIASWVFKLLNSIWYEYTDG